MPHWKPCTMLSFTEPRRALSTYNTQRKKTDHLSSSVAVNKLSTPVHDLSQKQTRRVACNHMRPVNLFHTSYFLVSTHQTMTHQHIPAKRLKHTSTFKWPKALFSHVYVNTIRGEVKSNILNCIHLQLQLNCIKNYYNDLMNINEPCRA